MRKISRTMYGAMVNVAQTLQIPYVPLHGSTLNEFLTIEPSVYPESGKVPHLGYLTIGDQGHFPVIGADGRSKIDHYEHSARDAVCHGQIPIALRPVTNDFSAEERKKYRLRKLVTIKGVQYFAYYAKVINLSNVTINPTVTVAGEDARVFETDASVFNPPKVKPTNDEDDAVTTSDGTELTATAYLEVVFDAADMAELKEVARVMYGDEDESVISDVMLAYGVDKVSTGPGPGNTQITYTEAIIVQAAMFVGVYVQGNIQNDGFKFVVDVGSTEPLFASQVDESA